MARKKKNNPVIIGDPGVGKTTIVEGLALKIVLGEAPRTLLDKRIVSLDLTSLIAGTKYRGQFEERIKGVVDEKNKRIYIDRVTGGHFYHCAALVDPHAGPAIGQGQGQEPAVCNQPQGHRYGLAYVFRRQ